MTKFLHSIVHVKIYYIIVNPRDKNTQQKSVQKAYTGYSGEKRKNTNDKKQVETCLTSLLMSKYKLNQDELSLLTQYVSEGMRKQTISFTTDQNVNWFDFAAEHFGNMHIQMSTSKTGASSEQEK